MKFTKGTDLVLNVMIPLLSGMLLYYMSSFILLPQLISNYLADGLWAYAFISALLIIWDREINITWVSIACIVAAAFELLQHNEIILGTGDVYDIITYYLFFILSLKLNYLFKTKIKQRS